MEQQNKSPALLRLKTSNILVAAVTLGKVDMLNFIFLNFLPSLSDRKKKKSLHVFVQIESTHFGAKEVNSFNDVREMEKKMLINASKHENRGERKACFYECLVLQGLFNDSVWSATKVMSIILWNKSD